MAMDERVAVVTGCSTGGIGHALAVELAAKGYHVVATSRSLSTMEDLRAHPNVELLALDVSSPPSSISDAISSIIHRHGRIDILINNAGTPCTAPTAELPLHVLENVFKTNVFGPLALIQAVVPHMVEARRGKIINVGSIGGFVSNPWSGGYCSSKAALHALTDSLRVELKPYGVQVILLAPGAVISNIGEKSYAFVKNLSLKIYKPYEEAIHFRARYSQQASSTPAYVFAKKAIDAVLRENPPNYFIYGYLSGTFLFLSHMPSWIRDWYFSKKFGLSSPSSTGKKEV